MIVPLSRQKVKLIANLKYFILYCTYLFYAGGVHSVFIYLPFDLHCVTFCFLFIFINKKRWRGWMIESLWLIHSIIRHPQSNTVAFYNFNTKHVFCYKCPKSYIWIIVQVELLFYFKNMYKCHKNYTWIMVQVELLRLTCTRK